MKKARHPVLFAAGLLLCHYALAMDIASVYELALANDPTFRADAADYQAEQQLPITARSALLPSLSANAGVGRTRNGISGGGDFTPEGSATFGTSKYGFNFNQTLFDRGAYLAYKQAQVRAGGADFDFAIARQSLIIRVVVRYFAVLAAQDNLDLTTANRKALQRQLELADERLQVGLGTTTDLFDAQARFSQAEAEEIEANTLLENSYQLLAQLIGQVPATPLERLKPDAPLLYPTPNDIEVWVQRALDNNLELLASKNNENFALQEIELQRSGHLPRLDFLVDHRVLDDEGSISGPAIRTDGMDALVQLSLPILQGGAVVSRTKEAGYRYQAAQQRVESARRSAEQIARAAFLNTTTRIRQVEAFDKAVLASESAVEAKVEGFEAGLNTNIDVLDAQRDLFRAQRDHLRSRYDYILNRLDLEQVIGDLDEDDIIQVNTWLK